jgi:hypothetical protein
MARNAWPKDVPLLIGRELAPMAWDCPPGWPAVSTRGQVGRAPVDPGEAPLREGAMAGFFGFPRGLSNCASGEAERHMHRGADAPWEIHPGSCTGHMQNYYGSKCPT